MRKILIVLIISVVLLVSLAGSAWAGMVVKVGPDFSGKIQMKQKENNIIMVREDIEVEMGFSIGGEYLYDLSDYIVIGGGVEFQLNRKMESNTEGFNFIPIYALGRHQFKLSPLYLTAKAGYNFFKLRICRPMS